MNCDEVRDHGMAYLDGEGDPAVRGRISGHFSACPACADWIARQRRLERRLGAALAAGAEMPGLWERVLARANVRRPAHRPWRPRALAGAAAAAALLWAVWAVLPGGGGAADPSDLDREAAELHGRWASGDMRPEMESASDLEVDRYLKAHAPFRVHCPPRSDVDFAVGGAGLRPVRGGGRAAYIVGRVGNARVTILVLDRAGLVAFPADEADLEGGRRRMGREGEYRLVSGIVAGNAVVVIGAAPPQTLEGLLKAYGTYPDG